uniref:Uncharacterized protein n=1 Tax=Acrobeloides nanus TaxID=290746 RepID=A0A914E5N3_9BILA
MGLVCYQNDETTGEVFEVENDDFAYCRYFPALISSASKPSKKEKSDGLLKDEAVGESFGEFFDQEEPYYKKYDFKEMARTYLKFKPKSKRAIKMETEYQFRCICNYDRCNSKASFEPYFG